MDQLEIPVGEFVFDARAAGPPDGELVLLLHGFPETSAEWEHQLAALAAAGYRAVAPDQRGYSPRARPDRVEEYEGTHLVADVSAIVDWLGADTFHLAGHDWGGAVAWGVAAWHPERIKTLTVVSTPHPQALTDARDQDEEQRAKSSYIDLFRMEDKAEDLLLENGAERLRLMYGSVGGISEERLDEYVRRFSDRAAMTAALNWYRAMKRSLIADVGAISVPTMYVWSDNDIALGRWAAERTAAYVSGPYRFEVIEGASHWIPEERPEDLNRLLLSHIAAHATGTFAAQ